MDVRLINPFVEAVAEVMPQLGFKSVEKVGLEMKNGSIPGMGVMALIGVAGTIKGNVIYNMELDYAKQIASNMMMGTPVPELDDMAQSAISEMANMLCANASIKLSNMGIQTDISTPTIMVGNDVVLKVAVDKVLSIKIVLDGIPISVDVAIE